MLMLMLLGLMLIGGPGRSAHPAPGCPLEDACDSVGVPSRLQELLELTHGEARVPEYCPQCALLDVLAGMIRYTNKVVNPFLLVDQFR